MFREFALPQADFIAVTITPNVHDADEHRRVAAPGHGAPERRRHGRRPRTRSASSSTAPRTTSALTEEEVRRELGEWRFLGSIPETKEWKRCNNLGELVATKNYHELNEAFSVVLVQATGEEMLQTTPAGPDHRRRPGRPGCARC